MHGRKKNVKPLSPEEKKIKLQKIGKYKKLKDVILAKHKAGVYNDVVYALTGQMIKINPDFYTLWNYRRQILMHFFNIKDIAELCEAELDVIVMGLQKNPKAYCAWHHRQWIVEQGTVNLENELDLCGKMLDLDPRNFHCWNYRRWIANRIGPHCEESEFAYTREKINQNFSNYSAWHYRSVLIPRITRGQIDKHDRLIDEDFELVKQAFYCEPEDQSAWLYHRWLLNRVSTKGASLDDSIISIGIPSFPKYQPLSVSSTSKSLLICLECGRVFKNAYLCQEHQKNTGHVNSIPSSICIIAADSNLASGAIESTNPSTNITPTSNIMLENKIAIDRQISIFERELNMCRELSQMEPNCKWVLLTTTVLIAGLHKAKSISHSSVIKVKEDLKEIESIFGRLKDIDPMRHHYYHDIKNNIVKQLN